MMRRAFLLLLLLAILVLHMILVVAIFSKVLLSLQELIQSYSNGMILFILLDNCQEHKMISIFI